ncbi:hypothetical protein AKO1_003161 [Acrasis kona]|uniref:Beta-defensin n=1 Tax=Acrasis kona TaxID=1008807 RepID=A0AAW2Z706_9EUKA
MRLYVILLIVLLLLTFVHGEFDEERYRAYKCNMCMSRCKKEYRKCFENDCRLVCVKKRIDNEKINIKTK